MAAILSRPQCVKSRLMIVWLWTSSGHHHALYSPCFVGISVSSTGFYNETYGCRSHIEFIHVYLASANQLNDSYVITVTLGFDIVTKFNNVDVLKYGVKCRNHIQIVINFEAISNPVFKWIHKRTCIVKCSRFLWAVLCYPPYHYHYIEAETKRQNCRHFPDDIFKCIYWKKMYKFRLRFHWSLFPEVQLTIFQAIIWTNDG